MEKKVSNDISIDFNLLDLSTDSDFTIFTKLHIGSLLKDKGIDFVEDSVILDGCFFCPDCNKITFNFSFKSCE